MAQGYTGYNIIDNEITIKDSPNLDAFSRLRVSNPLTVFTNQFTYGLTPLVFEEVTNNALTTDLKYDTINRCIKPQIKPLAVAGTYMYAQSYEYIPYQPGRSQLVFLTFNFLPPTFATTTASYKRIGLSDDDNGFELEWDPVNFTFNFIIRTTTVAGTQIVDQANWNLDKMDGTGPSGITLGIGYTQILVIDFQALYVGRVRMGFDIDGQIIYAHEFLHANNATFPYIATANLPVRAGIESVGTGVDDEFLFICASVASEGGLDDNQRFGYNFVQPSGAVTVSTSRTHVMSIRPKLLFNAYTNRVKIVFIDVEIYNDGNQPVYWELCIGQSIIGTTTYNDVNTTYSATEYNVLGTVSGSAAIVIDSGYAPASGGQKGLVNNTIISRYPITLDAAGAHRILGTLSLVMKSISGNQSCYGILKWKEIR